MQEERNRFSSQMLNAKFDLRQTRTRLTLFVLMRKENAAGSGLGGLLRLDGAEKLFQHRFLLEFLADAVALFGDDEFGFDCFFWDDAEFGFFPADEVDDMEKVGDEAAL